MHHPIRNLALCTALALTTAGCAALIPYIEPDAQARGELSAKNSCPIAGFSSINPRVMGFKPKTARPSATTTSAMKMTQLLAQLQSPDAAARTRAATDLGDFKLAGKSVVEPLILASRSDSSKWVRRAAIKSLGKIGTPDVVPALRAAVSDRDKWVSHSAGNALNRLTVKPKAETTVAEIITVR